MLKTDFLALSTNAKILQRGQDVCKVFNYSLTVFNNIDKMSEEHDEIDARFVLLSTESLEKKEMAAGMVQVARQLMVNSFILAVVSKKLDPESSAFIKKSGANAVLLEDEILNTSKLEFIATQKIKTPLIPVKTAELKVGTTVDFPLHHLMPRNEKFLTVVPKGGEVSPNKHQKMQELGEIYISRDDIEKFKNYVLTHQDFSAAGLASRCRAQFLTLNSSYVDLVMLLTDQSELGSFDKGKMILDHCQQLANELMTSLGSVGDAWEVIDNAAIGTFGSVERGPAIAAYAGLFSLITEIGSQNEVMLAALLSDIGLLELSPSISAKIRNEKMNTFSEEERMDYEKHTQIGLNLVLSRKLPLSLNVKNIISHTHERADGKGFPKRPPSNKIPDEAFLIQFCEMIDKMSLVKMGGQRVSPKEVRKKIYEQEFAQPARFPMTFLQKIKAIL